MTQITIEQLQRDFEFKYPSGYTRRRSNGVRTAVEHMPLLLERVKDIEAEEDWYEPVGDWAKIRTGFAKSKCMALRCDRAFIKGQHIWYHPGLPVGQQTLCNADYGILTRQASLILSSNNNRIKYIGIL